MDGPRMQYDEREPDGRGVYGTASVLEGQRSDDEDSEDEVEGRWLYLSEVTRENMRY
jgi:hypothetical protein